MDNIEEIPINLNLFKLIIDFDEYFSYLEYHSDQIIKASSSLLKSTMHSLIRRINIENNTGKDFENVKLVFKFTNPIFKDFELKVNETVRTGFKNLVPLKSDVIVDAQMLYDVEGVSICQLEVSCIDCSNNQELDRVTTSFKVLPIRHCSEDPNKGRILWCKYCITGFKNLRLLHQKAVELNSNHPIIAYQNKDNEDKLKEIDALYRAVHEYGIMYSNPPHSVGKFFQNVRLPIDVLSNHEGTCLDFSILFCSLLLEVGFHPILVLIQGHALVGCFLDEHDNFRGFELRNAQELFELSINQDRKIVLFNAVDASSDSSTPFSFSKKNGENLIHNVSEVEAIDVYSAQTRGSYASIPIKQENGQLNLNIKPVQLDKDLAEENEVYIGKEIEVNKHDKDRFTTWKSKLLDLTTSNKLVKSFVADNEGNIKERKSLSFAPLLPPIKANEIFELLKIADDTGSTIKVNTIDDFVTPNGLSLDDDQCFDLTKKALKNNEIYILTITSVLKKIIAKSKSAMEETGSATLYLAIGDVSFNDSYSGRVKGGKVIVAPLLLLPIELKKNTYGSSYTLIYDFSDIMINQTFFEYVKLKTNKGYDAIYEILSNPNIKLEDIVTSINSLNNRLVNARIDHAWISNFTFHHYVMWKDINDRQEDLKENIIIKSLLDNKSLVDEDDYFDSKTANELDDMRNFAAPLPYDSTQLKAIVECGRGRSFVLDGPPGTGKSQTIVNMIVNAMYQGKSVLFVAEKAAALDVVRTRLTKLNLDRFMLCLYGDKMTKSSFFEDFKRCYNLTILDEETKFDELSNKIEKEKSLIKKELDYLHIKTDKMIYSLYEAVVNYKQFEEYHYGYDLDIEFLDNYTQNKDEFIKSTLSRIIDKINSVYDYFSNPLRFLNVTSYSYIDQENIKKEFEKLYELLRGYYSDVEEFKTALKLDVNVSLNHIKNLLPILNVVFYNDIPLTKLFNPTFFENDSIDKGIKICKEMYDLSKKFENEYNMGNVLNIDIDLLDAILTKKRGFFSKGKILSEAKNVLSSFLKNNWKYSLDDIDETYKVVKKYRDLANEFKEYKNICFDFFDNDISSSAMVLEKCASLYSFSKTVYKNLKLLEHDNSFYQELIKCLSNLTDIKKLSLRPLFNKVNDRWSFVYDNILKLKERYDFNEVILDCEFKELVDFTKCISDDDNTFTISNIVEINVLRNELIDAGLKELINKIYNKEFDYNEAVKVYERALAYVHILKYYLNDEKSTYFNEFRSSDYEDIIEEYCNDIDKYNELCVKELKMKLKKKIKKIGDFKNINEGEIGELLKLANNSGKGSTIRLALQRFETIFRGYFPCFLMSPMAAAQLLDTKSRKFDIVIFDEASQIPTSEAVGPVARGKSLIVAGDPKQMPPSSYFSAEVNDTEDEDYVKLADSESFLDDCISIGLPSFHLSFHYRSKHESLIQFSNNNFYQGGLYTFPSADNLHCHISFKYVDVDKKANKLTKEEIECIVDTFKETAFKNKGKSIGVIVFNSKQQEEIADELEKLVSENDELRDVLNIPEDPYFVKNLENVQGDERDIIIMSVGFGKNSAGKASILGPLVLDKGERRLNVAASRAKEQMIVISTIKAIDIDASKSKNAGPAHLKEFLDYAEKSSIPMGEATDRPSNIGLTHFLKRDIESASDIIADMYVGNSGFKVDLALRRKDNDEYILGILLDEKPLSDNVSCRDRFFVQNKILNSLKWKIIRVYSMQYQRFPGDTIKKILKEFNDAEMMKKKSDREVINVIKETKDIRKAKINRIPYKKVTNLPKIDYDLISEEYYINSYCSKLLEIIKVEGPVSFERIKELSKEMFNITRIADKGKEIILKHLKTLKNVIATDDLNGEKFYWYSVDGTIPQVNYFRVGDREVEDISKEEMLYLINAFIENRGKANEKEIEEFILEELKLSTGRKIREKIHYVIDDAKEKKKLHSGYTGR